MRDRKFPSSSEYTLTSFDPIKNNPEETLQSIVDDIELHHPDLKALEIHGLSFTDPAKKYLQQKGYVKFEAINDGFVAVKLA